MAILLTHIIASLSSLALTGFTYFWPSKNRLRVAYALIGITVVTGVYLIWTSPASHVLSGCISGFTYLTFALIGVFAARHKLARLSESLD